MAIIQKGECVQIVWVLALFLGFACAVALFVVYLVVYFGVRDELAFPEDEPQ